MANWKGAAACKSTQAAAPLFIDRSRSFSSGVSSAAMGSCSAPSSWATMISTPVHLEIRGPTTFHHSFRSFSTVFGKWKYHSRRHFQTLRPFSPCRFPDFRVRLSIGRCRGIFPASLSGQRHEAAPASHTGSQSPWQQPGDQLDKNFFWQIMVFPDHGISLFTGTLPSGCCRSTKSGYIYTWDTPPAESSMTLSF